MWQKLWRWDNGFCDFGKTHQSYFIRYGMSIKRPISIFSRKFFILKDDIPSY